MGIMDSVGGLLGKAKAAVDDALEKTDLDEKAAEVFSGAKDAAGEAVSKAKDAVQGVLDKTDLDEKAAEAFAGAKAKVQEVLDHTDVDEKATEIVEDAKASAASASEEVAKSWEAGSAEPGSVVADVTEAVEDEI